MNLCSRLFAGVFVLLSLLTSQLINAQSPNDTVQGPFSTKVDFVSRYLWRGIQLSQSPCVQASAFYSKGNFSLGSWTSYTTGKESLQEFDLIATYSLGNFSLSAIDFFNPNDTLTDNHYFNWKSHQTKHLVECMLAYNGPETFPIQLMVGVAVFGNDRDLNGKNYYSTYVEANYNWNIQDYNVKAFVGLTRDDGFYTQNGFQVINVGVTLTRNIKITDHFNIPVSTSLIANPDRNSVYAVFALSL